MTGTRAFDSETGKRLHCTWKRNKCAANTAAAAFLIVI